MQHIFYSWQADTPTATGKNLIARALQDAITTLNANAEIDSAARQNGARRALLDHDTAGEPGSPPIVETIFRKIDRAAAFVSDLTYVAARKDGRRSPNPNVLFEHGWAWKSLSWRAVVSVMNIAHGDPDHHPLPFDLQHMRRPILFDCPDDATVEQRRTARARLTKALVQALGAILGDEQVQAARQTADTSLAKRDPRWEYARQSLATLAQDRVIGGVPRLVSRPCFVLLIVPLAAADSLRLSPTAVTEAQLRLPPNSHVRVEEGSDARQWWICARPELRNGPNAETAWLARIVRPGLLEVQATIGRRIEDDGAIVVDGAGLEQQIVGWYDRLTQTLTSLGLGGPGIAGLSLHGTEDVILARARPGGRKIAVPDVHLATLEISDLAQPIAPALHEAFDIMWQASGWRDGSPSYGNGQWAGYSTSRISTTDG